MSQFALEGVKSSNPTIAESAKLCMCDMDNRECGKEYQGKIVKQVL